MASVGVIGSGAWGTTLALLLAKSNIETLLWEYKPERAVEMQQRRENTLFLPGFRFPDMLTVPRAPTRGCATARAFPRAMWPRGAASRPSPRNWAAKASDAWEINRRSKDRCRSPPPADRCRCISCDHRRTASPR